MSGEIVNSGIVIEQRERHLQVRDPLLGEYVLDPANDGPMGMMADVVATPLGKRALDLTQLSKAELHTTIPETDRFSRLGHVLAVAEITNRLAKREGIDPERAMGYVLAASLSDLAHGPFSHATDIAVEGTGQQERFHELRSAEALNLGGVIDVLKARSLRVDINGAMDSVDIPKWVESGAPDVCVDRLQYTLQELLLWFGDSETEQAGYIRDSLRSTATLEKIAINGEGKIVMLDIDQARLFAKGYLLLSTEHWNDPVNRVQLYLLIEALKYAVIERRLPHMAEADHGVPKKPLDYLYAIDSDVLESMRPQPGNTDPYLFAIANQLAGVGYEERGRFDNFKRRIFETFLCDDRAAEYPSALLHAGLADFGPPSSQFEIQLFDESALAPLPLNPQVPQLIEQNGNLHYLLRPLKNRFIDPLVRTSRGDQRLSAIDPQFALLLTQHQRLQRSTLSVHIPTTETYRDLLWGQAQVTSKQFFEAQRTLPPMNNDPKRRSIEAAGSRAVKAAIKRGSFITS